MQIFSLNGRFYKAGMRLWHLIILNCCFLAGSLPIVTIGSSLISLNEGIRLEQKDEYSPRRFWKTWRDTFVIGLLAELVLIASFGTCAAIVAAIAALRGSALLALPILPLFALTLLVTPLLFIIPALKPHYRQTQYFGSLIKESISLTFTQTLPTILLCLAWILVIAVSIIFWRFYPLWLLLDFSLIAELQNDVVNHLLHF